MKQSQYNLAVIRICAQLVNNYLASLQVYPEQCHLSLPKDAEGHSCIATILCSNNELFFFSLVMEIVDETELRKESSK
jgi:hypothetical protein